MGQEKEHGIEAWTFFSKKKNTGYHQDRERKLVGDEVFNA